MHGHRTCRGDRRCSVLGRALSRPTIGADQASDLLVLLANIYAVAVDAR